MRSVLSSSVLFNLVFSSHFAFLSSLNPLLRLGVTEEAESDSWLQHAAWIPQSRGGLVMVADNDIYYRSGNQNIRSLCGEFYAAMRIKAQSYHLKEELVIAEAPSG